MQEAAAEAEDCKRAGGGEYFRRFWRRPPVGKGDRVYYVEDGYIRGYAVVVRVEEKPEEVCGTTHRTWRSGWFVYMDATTWQWIQPIRMQGFQGWRYMASVHAKMRRLDPHERWWPSVFEIVGGWLDPKPAVSARALRNL